MASAPATNVAHARLSKVDNPAKRVPQRGGGNTELSRFTARELIEELRTRGYKGKLYFTKEITI